MKRYLLFLFVPTLALVVGDPWSGIFWLISVGILTSTFTDRVRNVS